MFIRLAVLNVRYSLHVKLIKMRDLVHLILVGYESFRKHSKISFDKIINVAFNVYLY